MADGNRIAILLEDDSNVRAALEFLLTDLGWIALGSDNARDVLARLSSGPSAVGLIITDFNLGEGINGVDEARTLMEAGIVAPVLVMSSSMRGKAETAARAAGHDYLAKPVEAARVEAWIAAKGQ